MSKGQLFGPESNVLQDEATGVTIRQVTDHPSIHHHPFYYLPAWDDAMARLVFVSPRTGRRVCFTSAWTGFAQVYEAAIPEDWPEVLPSPAGAGGR